MAKNTLKEACEDEDFWSVHKRIKESANYLVALQGNKEDREHAIDLCIAKTWLEAKINKPINKNGDPI